MTVRRSLPLIISIWQGNPLIARQKLMFQADKEDSIQARGRGVALKLSPKIIRASILAAILKTGLEVGWGAIARLGCSIAAGLGAGRDRAIVRESAHRDTLAHRDIQVVRAAFVHQKSFVHLESPFAARQEIRGVCLQWEHQIDRRHQRKDRKSAHRG